MSDYRISTVLTPVVLNPDTFCPSKGIIDFVAQHDGHPWTKQDVEESEDDLIIEICDDIMEEVTKFVKEANPYGIMHERR